MSWEALALVRRIRLIVEYDGTQYVGWQIQPNGVAVQQVLGEALFSITGRHCTLHGSGRTDSGVHALCQVVHFDIDVPMAADKFCYALNTRLPKDIRVLYSDEVDETFHSRFSVIRKSYRYTVQTGPHDRAFTRNTALHIHDSLDLAAMERAAAHVLGEHDFAPFMAAGGHVQSTVRSIYRSQWTRQGSLLHYDVTGNGFLYRMVRLLCGGMIDIGRGRLKEEDFIQSLQTGQRCHTAVTAPAKGLALARVEYADLDTKDILDRLR